MKHIHKQLLRLAYAGIGAALLASCSGHPSDASKKTDVQAVDTAGKKTENINTASPKAAFDTLKDGDFISRYPNGVIQMRGYYKNGKREGDWASFFPTGQVQSEGFFTAGKRDHKGTVYYDNGKIMYEGMYKDGKQVGLWKFYDNTGKPTQQVDYDKLK